MQGRADAGGGLGLVLTKRLVAHYGLRATAP
jgi:hypothetical protein